MLCRLPFIFDRMTDDVFTEPDDTTDGWVDVRMTDPDAGEWDIDVVVADGRVEFVDPYRPVAALRLHRLSRRRRRRGTGPRDTREAASRQGIDPTALGTEE